jgi:hypothetical protein
MQPCSEVNIDLITEFSCSPLFSDAKASADIHSVLRKRRPLTTERGIA